MVPRAIQTFTTGPEGQQFLNPEISPQRRGYHNPESDQIVQVCYLKNIFCDRRSQQSVVFIDHNILEITEVFCLWEMSQDVVAKSHNFLQIIYPGQCGHIKSIAVTHIKSIAVTLMRRIHFTTKCCYIYITKLALLFHTRLYRDPLTAVQIRTIHN